jgi:DNA-binding response OmpR family regulator
MAAKKRVLLIDDDMDFREMAKIVLEAADYDVLEAADGEAGLELVKKEDVNFVLLDVMMEEVDTGCKIADEIVKIKSDVPVVILSSFADAAKQTFDVTSVPVKEYLQKPLKSDELLALVKKYT